MLELINVRKVYTTKAGNTVALNNVSLKFEDTGMVFITGKSGSGKTTLLNVVGGLDAIDSGEIIIDGRSFSSFTTAEYDSYRNTFVGFVFQESNLLPDYTLGKNIKIANELQGKECSQETIDETLKFFGIEGYSERKPSEISGGQKQRVAIARSLIKNPKIIMADEPTGALDSVTGIQVMEHLKALSKEKLVMVVSHDLELANKYADRIINIVDGRIVEDVTLSDTLITGNVYKTEDGIAVKSGSKLNTEETSSLVTAIENKEKVMFFDEKAIRKRENTKVSDKPYDGPPAKFIKSKMKTSTAAGLGIKSLGVKPIRLIITILLSVIAFAVFGLFDTVASYTNTRAISNLLLTSNYTALPLGAYYDNDEQYNYYDSNGNRIYSRIKFNEETIQDISESSGYDFRPVFDLRISDKISSDGGNLSYFSKSDYGSCYLYSVPQTGASYYTKKEDGFIEFKESEIVYNDDGTAIIDKNGFNVKLLYGEYPKLEYDGSGKVTDISMHEVAISEYMAYSLAMYASSNGIPKLSPTVCPPSDIINAILGSTIRFSESNEDYYVVGIIDTGKIPTKFDNLKNAKLGSNNSNLSNEFSTFLSSGLHRMIFVPEGFYNNIYSESGKIESVITGNQTYNVYFDRGRNTTSKYINDSSTVFRGDKIPNANIIMLDEPFNETAYEDRGGLKDGEIILNVSDIIEIYTFEESKVISSNPGLTTSSFSTLKSRIKNNKNLTDTLREDLHTYLTFLDNTFANTTYPPNLNPSDESTRQKTIEINQVNPTNDEEVTLSKHFKVVGIYTGLKNDGITGSIGYLNPPVLTANDLEEIGIYSNQGKYKRIIAPLKNNSNGATYVTDLILREEGLHLSWYGNNVIELLYNESEFIDQFARLFLYIALVLALFSVMMMFNYISTSIISKRESIGILRALGSGGKDIFKMFLTESLIIALINGVLACGLTALACIFINTYIKDIMNLYFNFALFGIRQVLVIMSISIATAFVSSLIPIIKIAKEKPVKLIREP